MSATTTWRAARPSRPRADGGFTLIELIIATAITGIVTAALAGMLSGVLLNAGSTSVRMSQTHDAQSALSYFSQDVASVGVRDWTDSSRPLRQSIETSAPSGGGLFPCGNVGTPNALVRMAWDDFDPANPATPRLLVTSYVVSPVAGGGSELRRLLCRDGTLVSDQALVRSLGPGASVTCAPTPAGCISPTPPSSVSLSLTVHDPQNRHPDYVLVLAGHRRQT